MDSILRFCTDRRDVLEFYRNTLVPEESIFQTILLNTGHYDIVNDSQRYFDFSSGTHGSPAVLGFEDLNSVFRSGAFFARKFDEERKPGVLDRVDSAVKEFRCRKHA